MAIIYSYPLNDNIKLSDELVGTTEQMINGRLKTVTRNFLLQDLGEFFTAGGGLQAKIILTTTGSSGPATLDDITGVLNIPEYLAGTVTSITALSPLTGGTITESGNIGIQIASGTQSGALSAANWNTFNNKQNLITLTVNGSSGAATFNQTTGALNIPQYSGSTNLDYIASASNGIVTSSTGLDATIPLANSINAGLLKPAKFTVLENTSGTNTGDQNLQSVTNLGASTTNAIYAQISGISNAITGESTLGKGIFGLSVEATAVDGGSISGIGVNGYSSTGIGVQGYSEEGVGASFDTDSATANIANFKKSGVVKASINNAGELTAQKLIKQGGFDYQFLKADGSVDNNIYLTSADLPSTLDLYATTTASDISGYTVLVRNIADSRYNTIAQNVSTGVITSIAQLVGSLVTDANIISGNPGVFDFKTIGNISRTSGTGQAEFFFRIYKRNLAGTETLIAESDYTLPVTNGGYVEFSATALWNDGVFLDTDRVVLKYYANRLASPVGSDPTYQFQFGGTSPVRSSAAIPTSVMPNIYLRDLADVENVDALNNEILYWNDPASLWEHSLAEDLVPLATATQKGLVSTTTQTIAGAKTFTGTIDASNLSGTNTGDETITTIKTKLGITTLSGSNTGDQNLSGYALLASPTFTGTPSLPTGTIAVTQAPLDSSLKLSTTAYVDAACAVVAGATGVQVSSQESTYTTSKIATVTAAEYAALTKDANTLYFITA